MNVEAEVAKSVQDDRAWKESRRRAASLGTKIAVGITAAGLLFSTVGAAIVGYVRGETLRPVPCRETFGYNTAGRGYSEVTCSHPAHRMEIREIKKPSDNESGLFEIRCTCDPRKAALLTCEPKTPTEIERMYQTTVQEPVDAVIGVR